MPYLKVVAKLNYGSLIPTDVAVNDFYFQTDDVGPSYPAAVAQITATLKEFYTGPTQTALGYPLAWMLSGVIARGVDACEFEFYDVSTVLSGGSAGSPFAITKWTLPASQIVGPITNLPSEVCSVLSYHSDYGSSLEHGPGDTRPRARKRGRLYIGPLNDACMETPDNDRVAHAFQQVLQSQAHYLITSSTNLHRWMQWSRRDGRMSPVVGGWIDDAWDTQRSRGRAATSRLVWS